MHEDGGDQKQPEAPTSMSVGSRLRRRFGVGWQHEDGFARQNFFPWVIMQAEKKMGEQRDGWSTASRAEKEREDVSFSYSCSADSSSKPRVRASLPSARASARTSHGAQGPVNACVCQSLWHGASARVGSWSMASRGRRSGTVPVLILLTGIGLCPLYLSQKIRGGCTFHTKSAITNLSLQLSVLQLDEHFARLTDST